MLSELDQHFGKIAVEQRFISSEQLEECQAIHETVTKLGVRRSLQDILVDKGYLTNHDVLEILRELVKEGVRPRLGNFEILSKIGEGGMGAVYKARQLSLDRIVALKVLPPRIAKDQVLVRRFLREAKTAGKLSHPNIISTLDVGESGDFHFIAMEYIEGPTLASIIQYASIIQKKGSIPEAKAVEIIAGIASGLAYASRFNIIHRDIKPANIMIASDGTAKLCDLGLAKQLFVEDASLTESGAAVGTPHYMSPEQAQGRSDIDARSDIYSLGATFFHMVTGQQPFKGDTPLEILQQRLRQATPSPKLPNPKLSDAVCAIVQKMMARDPGKRHQSAEELLADLRAYSANVTAEVYQTELRPPPTEPTSGPVRRHHVSPETAKRGRKLLVWGIGIGVCAVLVAMTILVCFLCGKRGPRSRPPSPPTVQSQLPPAPTPVVPSAAPSVPQQAAETKTPQEEDQDQIGEKMYLDAAMYDSRNESDYKGRIQHWQEVIKRAPRSRYASTAQDRIAEVQEAMKAASEKPRTHK
jgi:serine/threonine-protein kinase